MSWFWSYRKCFHFCHHLEWCLLGLVVYGLYYVEVGSLSAVFLGDFIINGYWILSKAFCASTEMIILLFFLQFVDAALSPRLTDDEKSLPAWNISHLIMISDPFQVLLNCVCQYFVEDFCVCNLCVCVCVCVWWFIWFYYQDGILTDLKPYPCGVDLHLPECYWYWSLTCIPLTICLL